MNIQDHADEMIRYKDWAPTYMDTKGLALPERQDWVVCPCRQNRDSEALERSNFRVMLKRLGGESETLEIHRFNHWACGWIEIALIHPSRAYDAAEIMCKLADYPVLDEMDWSELEHEESGE